jgi:hypothetical protein
VPENNRVDDAARRQGGEPRDHQRADKNGNHRPAVALHLMVARTPDRQRQHHERENRQEMDRAPRPPELQLVNEKRADRDREHEPDPDPAEGPVRQRALGGRELHEAERERRHRREGVKLDPGRGGQQRREIHVRASLFHKKRRDLVLRLRDREHSVQMAVGADELGGLHRRAVRRDRLHRFLDQRFGEDEIGRGVDDQRLLERRDTVAPERVVLRERRDQHVALAERHRGRQRVLGGVARRAEDVAVPFVAGDGIGDRRLHDEELLILFGYRQHRQRRARGRRTDGERHLVVGIGLFEQRLREIGLALIVLGEDHDLAAVHRHRAAGQKFEAEHQAGLGLLGVGFQRPGASGQ